MPIFTQMSPNMQLKEILLSAFYLSPFGVFKQRNGRAPKKLSLDIALEFVDSNITLFNHGRAALCEILKALPEAPRNEVLVSAYTCVVVPNAIRQAGFKPVYVDIEENSLRMSIQDLKSKITPQTSAIIVQHTFGFADKIKEIKRICDEKDIFLIEDLAHSLTAKHDGQSCGTFGAAAFLSFGTGKVISCGCGGAAIIRDSRISKQVSAGSLLSAFEAAKELNKIILFEVMKPLYFFFSVGKAGLALDKALGLLPHVLTEDEKAAKLGSVEICGMPNCLAAIASAQWKKKEKFLKHRHKIAQIYDRELSKNQFIKKLPYDQEASYLWYPIFSRDSEKVLEFMKKKHIILGHEWSGAVIVPKGSNAQASEYEKGSAPNAEEMVKKVIQLPTHIKIKERHAMKIVKALSEFYEKH